MNSIGLFICSIVCSHLPINIVYGIIDRVGTYHDHLYLTVSKFYINVHTLNSRLVVIGGKSVQFTL